MEYKKRFVGPHAMWSSLIVSDERCYVVEVKQVSKRFDNEYEKRLLRL